MIYDREGKGGVRPSVGFLKKGRYDILNGVVGRTGNPDIDINLVS